MRGRLAVALLALSSGLAACRYTYSLPDDAQVTCTADGPPSPDARLRALHRHLSAPAFGRGDPDSTLPEKLVNKGRALVLLGRPGEAVPLLERALRLRAEEGAPAPVRAEAEFLLAQALWDLGKARPGSVVLASAALGGYREAGQAAKVKQVGDWLRAHAGAP